MMKQVNDKLFVIWSSSDPEVAHNAALMYGHNSLLREWWREVRFIIWGPSAKIASKDVDIQDKLKQMMLDGVQIWACRACADNYGMAEDLEALGVDVRYVGAPVSEMLRGGWKQLTF